MDPAGGQSPAQFQGEYPSGQVGMAPPVEDCQGSENSAGDPLGRPSISRHGGILALRPVIPAAQPVLRVLEAELSQVLGDGRATLAHVAVPHDLILGVQLLGPLLDLHHGSAEAEAALRPRPDGGRGRGARSTS